MVVNQRSRAVLNGIDQTHQRGILYAIFVEGAIQLPPQLFEHLHKVLGGRTGDSHTTGKRAVEMGVGAHVGRQDELASGINLLSIAGGLLLRHFGLGADGNDAAILNQNSAIFDNLVGLAHRDERAIVNQHAAIISLFNQKPVTRFTVSIHECHEAVAGALEQIADLQRV